MNSHLFAAILLVTVVSTFYFGYLFGRDIEKEKQIFAKRVRDTYERN